MCFFNDLAYIQYVNTSDQIGKLIEKVKAQDFRSLARLLSLLEQYGPIVLSQYPELVNTKKMAFRIGITGPPGAGKSTLISQLIKALRLKGSSVAVIAVDPSSPFTQGAILGDRIRYSDHYLDSKVFIRSLGSRGGLGGLSSSAYLMLRAFDLAEFDYVLIETVGVGQTELEVMNVADIVSVVLVPESGDSIQAMKAGLLEISKLFLVNKSDRPGAEAFKNELQMSLNMDHHDAEDMVQVLGITAQNPDLKESGIESFVNQLFEYQQKSDWQKKRLNPKRLQAEVLALLRRQVEDELKSRVSKIDFSSPKSQWTNIFTEKN